MITRIGNDYTDFLASDYTDKGINASFTHTFLLVFTKIYMIKEALKNQCNHPKICVIFFNPCNQQNKLELHFRRFIGSGFGSKISFFGKAKHFGSDICRECAD